MHCFVSVLCSVTHGMQADHEEEMEEEEVEEEEELGAGEGMGVEEPESAGTKAGVEPGTEAATTPAVRAPRSRRAAGSGGAVARPSKAASVAAAKSAAAKSDARHRGGSGSWRRGRGKVGGAGTQESYKRYLHKVLKQVEAETMALPGQRKGVKGGGGAGQRTGPPRKRLGSRICSRQAAAAAAARQPAGSCFAEFYHTRCLVLPLKVHPDMGISSKSMDVGWRGRVHLSAPGVGLRSTLRSMPARPYCLTARHLQIMHTFVVDVFEKLAGEAGHLVTVSSGGCCLTGAGEGETATPAYSPALANKRHKRCRPTSARH